MSGRCISARITSLDKSLIQTEDESTSNLAHGGDDGNNSQEGEVNTDGYRENRDYPTFIKLITGSLVGGSTSYDDIYDDNKDSIPTDNDTVTQDEVQNEYFAQADSMQNEQVSPLLLCFVTSNTVPYSHLCTYNIAGNECPDIGRSSP